jgi:TonB-dependent SusC/RagA subfamily outer membrane receptor
MQSSSSSRAALSACVLIGLAAGCASGNTTHEPPASPTVTGEDMARNAGEPIERVLQTKFPGVSVISTPGGISVMIGGPSSFVSGSGPLYVVDESPVSAGPSGFLRGLNPYDIESIKVLRNPADIGIYGMRGANGVIVITTKRPSKNAPERATAPSDTTANSQSSVFSHQ